MLNKIRAYRSRKLVERQPSVFAANLKGKSQEVNSFFRSIRINVYFLYLFCYAIDGEG